MAEGPIEDLTLTENAQPAIMANAVATLRVSGIPIGKADFVAGHSLGEYDECARTTSSQVRTWAEQGIVNIVGGCCGTTPEHIAAIAAVAADYPPRQLPTPSRRTLLAGIEPMYLAA